MDAQEAVSRLGEKYPLILKKDDRKAFGRRRLATLCQILQSSGLSRDQLTARLAEDLQGCDPAVIAHITATTLSFWSGA